MGSTWNPDLIRRGNAMIAGEARAKGFNVLLGGGINLMRDPRNGRTFEYFGEDPLHSGLLGGAALAGSLAAARAAFAVLAADRLVEVHPGAVGQRDQPGEHVGKF